MFKTNSFSKSAAQFYSGSEFANRKIEEPIILGGTQQRRARFLKRHSQIFTQRKEKSLLNFTKIGEVLEAHDRVFRSSLGFQNPEKSSVFQSKKKVNGILKDFVQRQQFSKDKREFENSRQLRTHATNYRYFYNRSLPKGSRLGEKDEMEIKMLSTKSYCKK